MPLSPKHILLRIAGISMLSALLALMIACATNTPTPIPSLIDNVSPVAPTAMPDAAPTHLPRQHSGEQIAGLGEPVDAPHFVDSFPNHSQTLTQSPARIGINFDISLTPDSTIRIEHDGKALQVAKTELDARAIYMSAALPRDTGDGLYTIFYHACFAKENCSDGRLGFRVDSSRVHEFLDLTAQPAVTIHLQDVTYQPNQIIVTRGATVTWVNDDPFEHFVNSDPHPSHNAHPKLNSLDIPPTGTFSFTFDEPGEYAFHCSAHVPQNMFGTVLVRDAPPVPAAPTTGAQMEPTRIPTTVAVATATPIAPAIATSQPNTAVPTRDTPLPPTFTPIPPTAVPSPTVLSVRKVDEASLPPQKFAAHFVSSLPEHGDLLTKAPPRIELSFNFTLARNSNINVRKDGEKLTLGAPEFSENRLQMAANVPDAGAGTYHVLYRACWPDKSCHDGEFAFVVAP